MRLLITIILSALIWPFSAEATSYAPPEREEISSPNGEFLLIVDPETERHVISAAADPKTEIWAFTRGVWHFPFLLSNDGLTVAVVAWRHVKEDSLADGNCVTFYSSDGSEVRIPFSDVYPNPPKTRHVGVGPVGEFWRTWYHDVEQDGDTFTIVTTGGGSATFDLHTQALVGKRWIGLLKPMNLRITPCIVFSIAVSAWFFKRRSKKRAEQASDGDA